MKNLSQLSETAREVHRQLVDRLQSTTNNCHTVAEYSEMAHKGLIDLCAKALVVYEQQIPVCIRTFESSGVEKSIAARLIAEIRQRAVTQRAS